MRLLDLRLFFFTTLRMDYWSRISWFFSYSLFRWAFFHWLLKLSLFYARYIYMYFFFFSRLQERTPGFPQKRSSFRLKIPIKRFLASNGCFVSLGFLLDFYRTLKWMGFLPFIPMVFFSWLLLFFIEYLVFLRANYKKKFYEFYSHCFWSEIFFSFFFYNP